MNTPLNNEDLILLYHSHELDCPTDIAKVKHLLESDADCIALWDTLNEQHQLFSPFREAQGELEADEIAVQKALTPTEKTPKHVSFSAMRILSAAAAIAIGTATYLFWPNSNSNTSDTPIVKTPTKKRLPSYLNRRNRFYTPKQQEKPEAKRTHTSVCKLKYTTSLQRLLHRRKPQS